MREPGSSAAPRPNRPMAFLREFPAVRRRRSTCSLRRPSASPAARPGRYGLRGHAPPSLTVRSVSRVRSMRPPGRGSWAGAAAVAIQCSVVAQLLPVKLRILWPVLMLNRLSVAARRAVVGQEHGPAWAEGRYSMNQLHGFLTVWTIGWRMTVHGAEDRYCKGMCNSGSRLQPSKRVLCVLNFGGAGRYGSSCVGRYCIGP
jgi:hypothetical protein